MSPKRKPVEGFPEIPGEKLFDRRVRLMIWKQKNGIKSSADLRSRKRHSLAAMGKELVRLRDELEELKAKLLGGR